MGLFLNGGFGCIARRYNDRAISIRMISFEPPQMRLMRASRCMPDLVSVHVAVATMELQGRCRERFPAVRR
jgi:hypothetical protein